MFLPVTIKALVLATIDDWRRRLTRRGPTWPATRTTTIAFSDPDVCEAAGLLLASSLELEGERHFDSLAVREEEVLRAAYLYARLVHRRPRF